jgi:hypothetical protein
MKLRGLIPNIHIHISVSNLYISTIGPPMLLQLNRNISWKYTNRSQIHECRFWEQVRADSFLELFVSNFRFSVLAVLFDSRQIFKMDVPGMFHPQHDQEQIM